jgi:hypothetical protein
MAIRPHVCGFTSVKARSIKMYHNICRNVSISKMKMYAFFFFFFSKSHSYPHEEGEKVCFHFLTAIRKT